MYLGLVTFLVNFPAFKQMPTFKNAAWEFSLLGSVNSSSYIVTVQFEFTEIIIKLNISYFHTRDILHGLSWIKM